MCVCACGCYASECVCHSLPLCVRVRTVGSISVSISVSVIVPLLFSVFVCDTCRASDILHDNKNRICCEHVINVLDNVVVSQPLQQCNFILKGEEKDAGRRDKKGGLESEKRNR